MGGEEEVVMYKANVTVQDSEKRALAQVEFNCDGFEVGEEGQLIFGGEEVIRYYEAEQWTAFAVEKIQDQS
jgi:hypothetical protein